MIRISRSASKVSLLKLTSIYISWRSLILCHDHSITAAITIKAVDDVHSTIILYNLRSRWHQRLSDTNI